MEYRNPWARQYDPQFFDHARYQCNSEFDGQANDCHELTHTLLAGTLKNE
ncbi:MAG: hypothetical protein ABL903_02785 [Methylococcales bacterium]